METNINIHNRSVVHVDGIINGQSKVVFGSFPLQFTADCNVSKFTLIKIKDTFWYVKCTIFKKAMGLIPCLN